MWVNSIIFLIDSKLIFFFFLFDVMLSYSFLGFFRNIFM